MGSRAHWRDRSGRLELVFEMRVIGEIACDDNTGVWYWRVCPGRQPLAVGPVECGSSRSLAIARASVRAKLRAAGRRRRARG